MNIILVFITQERDTIQKHKHNIFKPSNPTTFFENIIAGQAWKKKGKQWFVRRICARNRSFINIQETIKTY